MNRKKTIVGAILLVLLTACTADDPVMDTGTQLAITVDTRSIVGDDYSIHMNVNGATATYTLTDGILKPIAGTDPLYVPLDATSAAVYAWGTVNYKLGDADDSPVLTMPVYYGNPAAPLIRTTPLVTVDMTLKPVTSLVRLTVTDAKGGNFESCEMPGVYIPRMENNEYMWTIRNMIPSVAKETIRGGTIDPETGLLEIISCTITAGSLLFTITVDNVEKNIYAMKDYHFMAGKEYEFIIETNK